LNNESKKLRVYFLGAGTIAAPVLAALVKAPEVNLVGAGTQIDRPAGRNRVMTPTPVGIWAAANGIAIDKVPSVNAPEFLEKLAALQPQIILVISFGQLLKRDLLHLPGATCVNIHASLLPSYRGASPITASILHRDETTGVSFMQMEEGLDTGPVYCQLEYPLQGNETTDWLELQLGELAANETVSVLQRIVNGELRPVAQDQGRVTMTRKITKHHGEIDWHLPACQLEAMTRAFHPWPGAVFSLAAIGKDLHIRVVEARVLSGFHGRPGEVLLADKRGWVIACGEHALELLRVVPQGRKEMTGIEFLRGCRIEAGAMLAT